MKFNLATRVLSATLALTILLTGCGSTNGTENTQTGSAEVNTEITAEPEVTIETEEAEIVTTPVETEEVTEEVTVEETTEETVAEPELTAEEQEWLNYVLADVEESLNVRTEASAEAELAGKLEKGDLATVLEVGTEWTKIQSGNLTGYVSNEYCIYGLEALAYAKENINTVATTTVDGLRIRKEMNTESTVIKRLDLGEKLVVDTTAATEEGWVAVKCNDSTYYVSAEYVTVAMDLGTGITIAEIEEQQRKEAEAKAKEEEAKKEAQKKAQASSGKTTKADLEQLDDLTLLAAIIFCEAGGESYECKLAVASVVMNRLNSSKYPDTIAGVLAQSGQFPPAVNGKLMNRLANGKVTQSCYDIAREALAGKNNAQGLYFFNDYNGTQTGMRIDGMIFW